MRFGNFTQPRWAMGVRSFMLVRRIKLCELAAIVGGTSAKGSDEARMVDLLSMFRRRPAKRGKTGFARSREDITALGDNVGEMLSNPVRDAPSLARAAPSAVLELPRVETSRSPFCSGQAQTLAQASVQDQRRGRTAHGAAGGISGCA